MHFKSTVWALIAATTLFTSCSKNDDGPDIPEDPGNYILAVTPAASTGVADYLLTASNLETGTISTAGNGVEQDGTYRYYVTSNNKFFSMLYGQGNPGAVTTYNIKNGKLNKLSNFQSETVQAFAPVKDDILMFKISRNLTSPTSTWYKVNTNSLLITSEGAINTLDLHGKGEVAHFSWLTQVGDKVFAPYFGVKDRSFNTDYPNEASIAIFNYADMKVDKVIKDTRTSFIGRYFVNGLGVVENGDIYAFSSSVATTGGALSSTKPAAVSRIKANTTEYDQTYLFDIEAASGGMNITDWIYVGNNNFVVNSSTKAEKGAYVSGTTIAIVNVVDKTFRKVTGMPAATDIKSLTTNNYTPKDGKTAYMGVNLKDGNSWVYKIDASSASATKGLKVDGGVITAIQNIKSTL
jgi:hypothetical protein